MFVAHRINTVNELSKIPNECGIEIDLRDFNDTIILSHDPFNNGELFTDLLDKYNHKFLILNVKSERIEFKIIELLKKYNIKDYFFLDSTLPMMITLSKTGEKNMAVRYSEYESLESVLLMKDIVSWVWVDCFNVSPLTEESFKIIKNAGLKICVVSPELQNQPEKIDLYVHYHSIFNMVPDMVCSKIKNLEKWEKIFN